MVRTLFVRVIPHGADKAKEILTDKKPLAVILTASAFCFPEYKEKLKAPTALSIFFFQYHSGKKQTKPTQKPAARFHSETGDICRLSERFFDGFFPNECVSLRTCFVTNVCRYERVPLRTGTVAFGIFSQRVRKAVSHFG